MQRDDFMKLKLKFAQTDVAGKIAIYTETPGLSAAQYKELLRMYPIEKLEELEQLVIDARFECTGPYARLTTTEYAATLNKMLGLIRSIDEVNES